MLRWLNFHTVITDPRPPILDQPLVILTNSITGSGAEHLARILQEHAGALLVGDRTAGAEAAIQVVEAPDGSTLRFGSDRRLAAGGRGIQGVGVLPDLCVPFRLEDVRRLGRARAREEFERRTLAAIEQGFALLWKRRDASSSATSDLD